jgi:hypothetical protein
MKNREIISEVRNSLRAASLDDWIPAKFIFFKLKGIASLFIKREADDKRLFRYTELWATIKCLEMEEEDLVNCCDITIPNCTKVMRSKEKLPEVYSTRFGYLMNVTSVDYDRDYIPTNPQQYKYTKSREFIDKRKRYYWIENGHLVIPDSLVSVVTVKAMFTNKAEALRLDNCTETNDCIRFLDQEFVAPEHLLQNIKNAAVLDILNTNRKIPQDELSNLNSNEKSNPVSI